MQGRLVLLVMIAAACRKEASPPSREPRLFTEVEIAAYEAQLTARLAETAKRTCVRPVVREPGTDTAAAPDLIALAEPTGSLATCLKTFTRLDGGDLEVSPPAWVETKKPPWRISCKLR